MSNSIGRGAVENIIKNTVYEKYNIDGKAMKDFSRLSPTEMISDFKGSVCELGRIREDYKNGIYTKADIMLYLQGQRVKFPAKCLKSAAAGKVFLRIFCCVPSALNRQTFPMLKPLRT